MNETAQAVFFCVKKTKTSILKDWSSKFKEINCLFVTPTHEAYLDNSTRTRLTVNFDIFNCNKQNTIYSVSFENGYFI